jgi:hypothetical protein
MSDTLADTLSALEGKATAGPWTWTDDNGPEFPKQWRIDPGVLLADCTSGTPGGDEIDRANAALIVALRNFLPDILAALREREVMRAALDAARALAEPEGWRPIESAPRDRPFWARKPNNEIALCWRHNPSSRTDEVVTWKRNQGFRAVEWRYPDPLPPAPQPDA